jgi:hypothetical protein
MTLTSEYAAFERRRTSRRQYQKAFGGLAMIVLAGAVLGQVPVNEAEIVAGLLAAPPLVLAALEVIQWHRLVRHRDRVRALVQSAESRKKAIRIDTNRTHES